MLNKVDQFAVLRDLAAAEDRPIRVLDRGLRDKGVVLVTFGGLAAPGERSGKLPTRSEFPGIERACRPAFLVDSRLQLFRILEVAPAALQREFGSRVPGYPCRHRVQRARLYVP